MTLVNGEWEWECPDGYHTVDDDETGQCYPNSEECPVHLELDYPVYKFFEGGIHDEGDRCAVLNGICGSDEENVNIV